MPSESETTLSRRKLLASAGAGAVGLGALPVVYGDPDGPAPTIVGHRGVAGLEAPNSMAGVRRAAELGADAVALDVRETADGELVLFHDPRLEISTNGTGRIEEKTLEELSAIRVDGEPIPTLEEALEFVAETRMGLYLELKKTGYGATALEKVEAAGLADRTMVTSFRPDALAEAADGRLGRGVIGSVPHPGLFEDAAATDASMVASHYVPYGLEWLVDEANARGLAAGVWELVSTETHIEDALSFDIDLLVTNRPDIAIESV